MAVIKCKICGGDLLLDAESNVAECEYCGTRQTAPTADNEKKLNLFARANRLRANNEFDKAAGVYESIVADFPEEAEAYWGLILCKYGIEYVDDPATGKKIPTCHRTSFDSVMDDPNFELVMENADPIARRVYRGEAKQIEELRKGIIEVSSHEEPYDIFICYKETDESGQRTLDSVMAQDVYDMLTENGYRVFFSRVSLEDKLGVEYEPYIFAALNSAKIMLAFGTDYAYYNAVWVKNEWSRFLQLIARGEKKTLIPCYKNLDAYDMPKEFAKLQAQDMGKIGAMQDLLRGIQKILPREDKKTAVSRQTKTLQFTASGPTVENLVRRGFYFLEENNWDSARGYFNRVLDINVENPDAYIGLMLAEKQAISLEKYVNVISNCYREGRPIKQQACAPDNVRVSEITAKYAIGRYLTEKEIKKTLAFDLSYPAREPDVKRDKARLMEKLTSDRYYCRARQYQTEQTRQTLDRAEEQLAAACDRRISAARREDEIEREKVISAYRAFLDQTEEAVAKKSKAVYAELESIYNSACKKLKYAVTAQEYRDAARAFSPIVDYKDSEEKIRVCGAIAEDVERSAKKAAQEAELRAARAAKKRAARETRVTVWLVIVGVVAFLQMYILTAIVLPASRYHAAEKLLARGKNLEAAATFAALGNYRDSAQRKESIPVLFGELEQDGNTRNGKEPIEWIVLAKRGDRALLVSKYVLDCQPYNAAEKGVTWQTCSLREQLNGTFLKSAFSLTERSRIVSTAVSPDRNPAFTTNPGGQTTDKIFLLSLEEIEKYFKSDTDRRGKATEYAVSIGVNVQGKNRYSWWWLRSPGEDQSHAVYIYSTGSISSTGNGVNTSNGGVRPAMWVSLNP